MQVHQRDDLHVIGGHPEQDGVREPVREQAPANVWFDLGEAGRRIRDRGDAFLERRLEVRGRKSVTRSVPAEG